MSTCKSCESNNNQIQNNSQRFPLQRSNFDVYMQKKLGTNCVEGYKNLYENYPSCNGQTKVLALEDPANPWSFFAYYDTPKESVKESYDPTMVPNYPTISPDYPLPLPTMTPNYPTMAPNYPTMAPNYPTMAPKKQNKKGLFLFCFAEWCGYSKMYKSTWEKLKKHLEHSYDFGIIDMSNGIPMIDDSIPSDVHHFIKNGNVTRFPTILFIQKDNNNNIKIDVINNRDNIEEEVLNRFGDLTYI